MYLSFNLYVDGFPLAPTSNCVLEWILVIDVFVQYNYIAFMDPATSRVVTGELTAPIATTDPDLHNNYNCSVCHFLHSDPHHTRSHKDSVSVHQQLADPPAHGGGTF
jgi:hypothetical protein